MITILKTLAVLQLLYGAAVGLWSWQTLQEAASFFGGQVVWLLILSATLKWLAGAAVLYTIALYLQRREFAR